MILLDVVFVSKNDSFSFTEEDEKNFFLLNPTFSKYITFTRIPNNTDNLTKVYNRTLDEKTNGKQPDFVAFVHSDSTMDFIHIFNKLDECKEKYDVIGLCGTQRVVTSQTPLNWFTSSIPCPDRRVGCVKHGDGRESYFSRTRPGLEDAPVGMIDGVFIAFGRRALERGIRFDEQFAFDQYDSDISFQALLKYNLRLGVIVEKSLVHQSVGKSILTRDFLVHELDFRKKWNLDIPKGTLLERLVQKADGNELLT